MNRKGLFGAALLAALFWCGAAQAQSATDSFTVSATVNAACTIDAGDIAFGNWDPLTGDATSTGTIVVTCTNTLPWAVALSNGNWDPTQDCAAPARRMFGGIGEYLEYGLYQDAGYATSWGCDASNDLDGAGTSAAQNLTVHARIPAAQGTTGGLFSDSVIATITF